MDASSKKRQAGGSATDMSSEAQLQEARDNLEDKLYRNALQSLESTLARSFEIRNNVAFHILKASALRRLDNNDEALKAIRAAETLFKADASGKAKTRVDCSSDDKLTYLLEYAMILSSSGNYTDSVKYMQEAWSQYGGTMREDRISMAQAELALQQRDYNKAVSVLATVTPESSLYIQAKQLMADIYLTHKKDKKAYARCCNELVERCPSVEAYVSLADAYITIQEPEKAIDCLNAGLMQFSDSLVLAVKMGEALVKIYDFSQAVDYYESAMARVGPSDEPTLQYNLAHLYNRLAKYAEAERVIKQALDHPTSGYQPQRTMYDVKFLRLLAQSYRKQGRQDEAIAALTRAKEALSILSSRGPGVVVKGEKSPQMLMSEVSQELAEVSVALSQRELAVEHFNEAIQCDPHNKKALLSLSKYHISHQEYAAAQTQLATLLRLDDGNEEASLLIGQIMTNQNQLEQAAFHLRQILEKQVRTHTVQWKLMASYVDLSRRVAKLPEAEELIQSIVESNIQRNHPAGLYYCQGLYYRYSNNVAAAIKALQQARQDSEFGVQATVHMIELFLNPDNETIGGEAFGLVTTTEKEGGGGVDAASASDEAMAVATVKKLLQDLPRPKSLRHRVLEAQMFFVGKKKASVERGVNMLQTLLEEEADYIPALLAISEGCMLTKQAARAKNYLKRIAKAEWTSEFADDLEKAWILLADGYIQTDKLDTATVFLQSCLDHNRSCAKAWEYMGLIHEKSDDFKQASTCYRRAWDINAQQQQSKNNVASNTDVSKDARQRPPLAVGPGGHWHAAAPTYPTTYNSEVGFKLAYSYLRIGRHLDAITTCHAVLKQAPDYPRMRREILDKARAGLRP